MIYPFLRRHLSQRAADGWAVLVYTGLVLLIAYFLVVADPGAGLFRYLQW